MTDEVIQRPVNGWRFIPHPDAERFDKVVIEPIERWKESELSGDEWRFTYSVSFYSHGEKVASTAGSSMQDALILAASQFSRVQVKEEFKDYTFYGNLEEVCCQPGCDKPWIVLKHPRTKTARHGETLKRGHSDDEVRGFCERHQNRGDCAIDDADPNYVVVEHRFPPDWEKE